MISFPVRVDLRLQSQKWTPPYMLHKYVLLLFLLPPSNPQKLACLCWNTHFWQTNSYSSVKVQLQQPLLQEAF